MTLYITGFSLAGKTTSGRLFAERYGLRFTDLDNEVERLAGMPIPMIFESGEEKLFREWESQALRSAGADVVATGGGTMTVPANVDYMRAGGTVALLAVSPSEVWRRLQMSFTRPLLRGGGIEGIRRLMFRRAADYCRGDFVLDVTNLKPAGVVEALTASLGEYYIDSLIK